MESLSPQNGNSPGFPLNHDRADRLFDDPLEFPRVLLSSPSSPELPRLPPSSPEFPSSACVTWRGTLLSDLTYTVLDVETTGLKPCGHGMTEICCLRVSGGRIIDRLSTLINPGRPIPMMIQRMTGISDNMVEGAPDFGEIIPSLLEFVDNTVLVAHRAPFDLGFLNYGLYCYGYPKLHNPVVDTLRLSRKLLPDLPRASLDAVSRFLGISIRGRHRAQGDAEATVQVLLALLRLCREQGVETDAQLLALLAPVGRERTPRGAPRGGSEAARQSVLAERCRAFPEAPGVYLMRGASGRVLYVGKAVSLRRRLASYFGARVQAKTRRLLREVETIEHRQAGSELEALLEESRLIKHHQPPFNTLLRSYHDFPFIKVEAGEDYPHIRVTRHVGDDGARYFGPFRGMRSTEMVVEVLCRCFRLFDDRCPERSRGDACLYRQMGRCLAPCLGEEQRASYRQAVEEVCRLLESHPDDLVAELVRRRDAAAERLDFETAALYRDGIDALGHALSRRRLLAPAVEGLNLLAVCPSLHPGAVELFVFGAGRLAGRTRMLPDAPRLGRPVVEALLERAAREWPGGGGRAPVRIDAESLDQVNIISAWLEKQGAAASIVALEPGWAGEGRGAVVDRVMELTASRRKEAPWPPTRK